MNHLRCLVSLLPSIVIALFALLTLFVSSVGSIVVRLLPGVESAAAAKVISLGFLFLAAASLALLLNACLRRAWLEIGLVTLVLFVVAVLWWSGPPTLYMLPIPTPTPTNQVSLQLKASDLASGAVLVQPNEYVTLVLVTGGGDGKKPGIASYPKLQVRELFDANGRGTRHTGSAPDSILLSVPKDKFSDIIVGLADKKAAYLLPQGTDTVTPTATPEPTSTPVSVEFELPADKIKSDLSNLELDSNLVVIVVAKYKDSEGDFVAHEAHRYDQVTLLDVLDKNGARPQSYEEATTVRISLPLVTDDGPAVGFAAHLTDASTIYLLPVPPTPTPTPTSTPTEGG